MPSQKTPIRRQYERIRQRFDGEQDIIFLMRLGDFYEAFDDQARILADELDIVYTTRVVATKPTQRVPMAGFPYHAADGYVRKLLSKGWRVAIIEQTGDIPDRGLYPRDVRKVHTPGEVFEHTGR